MGPKLRAAGRRQGAGLEAGRKAESGLALVQWLSSPVEGAESCSLQVLQLLNELLEVRRRQETVALAAARSDRVIPVLHASLSAFRRRWEQKVRLNVC